MIRFLGDNSIFGDNFIIENLYTKRVKIYTQFVIMYFRVDYFFLKLVDFTIILHQKCLKYDR